MMITYRNACNSDSHILLHSLLHLDLIKSCKKSTYTVQTYNMVTFYMLYCIKILFYLATQAAVLARARARHLKFQRDTDSYASTTPFFRLFTPRILLTELS